MSSAEKITWNSSIVQQKAEATHFFRKAGESSFFGPNKANPFFQAPVQTKLSVSTPDDPHEKEADAVAEKVMRMPDPVIAPQPIQAKEEKLPRKEEEEIQPKLEITPVDKLQCKEEPDDKIQAKSNEVNIKVAENKHHITRSAFSDPGEEDHIDRKPNSLYHSDIIQRYSRGPPQPSPSFQQDLAASKGSGNALPAATLTHMGSRFNADFSGVRVHTGAGAEKMNDQVQAKAFAHGNDIYFNKGNYAPGTSQGNLLLAHELTHTIQQGASPLNNNVARKSSPENAPATADDFSNISGGYPLPSEARDYFQSSFKTEVGDVKIHSDFQASALCMSRRVPAFVQGAHIFFAAGRYSPESEDGGALLARQVSDSLTKRGIGVPGMAGQLSAGISEVKSGAAVPAPKPKPAEATNAALLPKDKKKAGVVKESKGKKGTGAAGKGKGKKKGDSDGRPFPKAKAKPNAAPATPQEDPAFHKSVEKARATSKQQKQHDPAEAKANDAQKAATAVPKEAESQAQNRKTGGMDEAGAKDKPFDSDSFKADLLKKIESVTPHSLEEATEFKENNKIGEVKNAMGSKVGAEKENSTGPVSHATTQPLQVNEADNKQPVPLPPTLKGSVPCGPSSKDAAPKSKLNNEISLQDKSKSLDDEMKANNVTEDQLSKSNEPDFAAALSEKKGAQKDAVQRPLQYRKDEVKQLNEAKSSAQQESSKSVAGMFTARGKNLDTVVAQQQTTKQKDEERRANVAKQIEEKYQAAEKKVTEALAAADTESASIFDQGSAAAQTAFENEVAEKMRAYKRRRYSGFWGGLRWAKDKLFGMPDAVNSFYTEGRQNYLDRMDKVITQVANVVTAKLNEAKQAIKDGKKNIDDYVKQLPTDLADVGKEAASGIQDKFDTLEQNVNDKREQLIDGLAKKYVDNVKKLDDRISEMKEANQGLVDKAIGFLKKVWKVIKDLTNLFTTILSKLASIIGTILSSPSGFFDNLAKAFKIGFNNFKNNFLQYLEQGLMSWLVTNLGIAGVEVPEKFNPAAVFTLALQVMGITKPHIRERAVAVLDEEKVSLLEGAGGLIYRVFNEGIHIIWDMIVEKLTDFKDLVWEAIKSFIQKSIIEAALVFILSMLNPIGAFIKVCMAIYDFLMMLVKFKDRIIELLDTVLNAVTSIASGSVDGAAKAIEGAFAKSIPIIIGFLAALLHLNNITAKVRDIILRIQKRVEKAIDWVILKAWSAIGSTVEGALRIKQKGKAMVEKGKEKIREAVGGGGTPQERLDHAMRDAGNAVNRYAGKKVGGLILKPLLATIRMRYGLVSLELIPKDGKWAVRGEINPVAQITSDAEVQEGPEGGQAKTTIQKIIGYQNGEIVKTIPKYAGTRLREILSALSNAVISKDESKIQGAISQVRGKDKDYTIYQGAIYAPFVEDQEQAIKELKGQHAEAGYFLSLDRGGSMVGDQIVNETVTSNQSIPREEAGDYRAKQLSDLDVAIATIMRGKEKEPVRIAISETSVSGGSVGNLVKYLKSLLGTGKYPNLKFKVLVLQQTITGLDRKARSIIQRKVASAAGKIDVVISNTRYILGEDVNYQIAKKNENSHAPVILFKGTEETLVAFSITPIEGSTARDIIIDLVDGKYKGKLPGVL